MRKFALAFFLAFSFGFNPIVKAQEFLTFLEEPFPNRLDSNNVICNVGGSYMVAPEKNTTAFQKSRLGESDPVSKPVKFVMGIAFFPSQKYDNNFQPLCFFEIKANFPNHISTKFGGGVSVKSLNSSFGLFYGNYERRTPEGGNITTRRSKVYEHASMYGFYLQTASRDASFFFSASIEKTQVFYSSRLAWKVGNRAFPEKTLALKAIQVVSSYESLSGLGFGLSTSIFRKTRFDISWVTPFKDEVFEQARVENKLVNGLVFGFSVYID